MSDAVLKALLPCAHSVLDVRNRWTVVGVFNTVTLEAFPGRSEPFQLFAHVADMPLSGEISVQIETPNGMIVWTTGVVPFRNTNPGVRVFENVFPVPPVLFNAPGIYRIALFVGADRLGEMPLHVQAHAPDPAETE